MTKQNLENKLNEANNIIIELVEIVRRQRLLLEKMIGSKINYCQVVDCTWEEYKTEVILLGEGNEE